MAPERIVGFLVELRRLALFFVFYPEVLRQDEKTQNLVSHSMRPDFLMACFRVKPLTLYYSLIQVRKLIISLQDCLPSLGWAHKHFHFSSCDYVVLVFFQ